MKRAGKCEVKLGLCLAALLVGGVFTFTKPAAAGPTVHSNWLAMTPPVSKPPPPPISAPDPLLPSNNRGPQQVVMVDPHPPQPPPPHPPPPPPPPPAEIVEPDGNAYFIELGVRNRVDRFSGLLQFALWDTQSHKSITPLMFAIAKNKSDRMSGLLQFAFGTNQNKRFYGGIQLGLVRSSSELFVGGMQLSIVDNEVGKFGGLFQSALFRNRSTHQFTGLFQLAGVNHAQVFHGGMQIGILNYAGQEKDDSYYPQLNPDIKHGFVGLMQIGPYNRSWGWWKGGIQVGGYNAVDQDFAGLGQVAVGINAAKSHFIGAAQVGLANMVDQTFSGGVQAGFFNSSRTFRGALQIGVTNFANEWLNSPKSRHDSDYDRPGFQGGIQAGVINMVDQRFEGIGQIGVIANGSGGNFYGLMQVSGIANVEIKKFYGGFQIAPINMVFERFNGGAQVGVLNFSNKAKGTQWGLANISGDELQGFQVGAVNFAGDTEGFELGIVNISSKIRGVQIGLVNRTDELHGLQIGLINMSKKGGLPVVPIANAGFLTQVFLHEFAAKVPQNCRGGGEYQAVAPGSFPTQV
jgi:hypothetical protein